MFDQKSSSPLHTMKEGISHCAQEAADSAQHQAQEAMDVVHASAQQMKNQIHDFSDTVSRRTTQYVKNDPLKSMLIAAASGAALAAVFSYVTRSRR